MLISVLRVASLIALFFDNLTLLTSPLCYLFPRRNLTYKTISWLSWVNNWCPGTPFIAKIDDDVVVNPFNLRLYLHKHLLKNPSPKNIHGRARFKAKPMRQSKWAVTKVSCKDYLKWSEWWRK